MLEGASLEAYRWVQAYLGRDAGAKEQVPPAPSLRLPSPRRLSTSLLSTQVKAEYGAIEEMLELLPLKLARMDDAIGATS